MRCLHDGAVLAAQGFDNPDTNRTRPKYAKEDATDTRLFQEQGQLCCGDNIRH